MSSFMSVLAPVRRPPASFIVKVPGARVRGSRLVSVNVQITTRKVEGGPYYIYTCQVVGEQGVFFERMSYPGERDLRDALKEYDRRRAEAV